MMAVVSALSDWRVAGGVIEKARRSDTEWQTVIDSVAEKFGPRVRDEFVKALQRYRDQIDLKALIEALDRNDIGAALVAIMGRGSILTSRTFEPLWEAFEEAGVEATRLIGRSRAAMAFDGLNPDTLAFLQNYRLRLIREIDDETREAIRDILIEQARAGDNPRVAARRIRETVGLTRQQTRAVTNYRRALENLDGLAVQRALRDKRFDRTVLRAIREDHPLTKAQIDDMVERYRERYLKHRAETIARSESIRAANAGAYQAIRQAAARGDVPAEAVRRYWVVAPGERTCPICRAIPKLNPNGVGLMQMFKTPVGPLLMPIAHPSCRCTTAVRLKL